MLRTAFIDSIILFLAFLLLFIRYTPHRVCSANSFAFDIYLNFSGYLSTRRRAWSLAESRVSSAFRSST